MANRIRQKINHNRTIIANFSYLSIFQFFNIISPLIAYPYLIKVLGKDIYGLVIFAQAIIYYLAIIVSFGFNISGTKFVSINRNNKDKLSEIVSSIFIIKAILLLLSILLLNIILFYTNQAKGFYILFYLSLWICVYDVIFPQWYFQGIENMKYITLITLFSRTLFLCLIFIIIDSSKDYLYVPIINGVGAIFAGAISLYIIFYRHRIKFKFQSFSTLSYYLKDSLSIFLSNISVNIYKNTNKVVIGIFLGMTQVTYYDLAERIVNVFKIPHNILSQTIFPRISNERNINFVKVIFKYSVFGTLMLYILLTITSNSIVLYLGGPQMMISVNILYILGLSIPIIAIGNIFGVQSLIAFGLKKEFTKVVLITSILYFILLSAIFLFMDYTVYNVSIVTLMIETFTTFGFYYYCRKSLLWQ